MSSLRTFLTTTRELAEQSDRLVCDLASGKKKWEMCVPPQPTDTDMVLVKVSREALPLSLDLLALAVEALENVEKIGMREFEGEPACNLQGVLARECLTAMAEKLKETR